MGKFGTEVGKYLGPKWVNIWDQNRQIASLDQNGQIFGTKMGKFGTKWANTWDQNGQI